MRAPPPTRPGPSCNNALYLEEGQPWSHTCLYRVYCALRLNLPHRTTRRVPQRVRQPLQAPSVLNRTWALDFMGETLYDGRRVRLLTVIDEGNREGLEIAMGLSVPAIVAAGSDHRVRDASYFGRDRRVHFPSPVRVLGIGADVVLTLPAKAVFSHPTGHGAGHPEGIAQSGVATFREMPRPAKRRCCTNRHWSARCLRGRFPAHWDDPSRGQLAKQRYRQVGRLFLNVCGTKLNS